MKLHHIFLIALMLIIPMAGCKKDLLEKPNPNQPTAEQFWKTQADAVQGVNAAYGMLQRNGTYNRWLHFAYDLRSDEGLSNSPWTDLANFVKFVMSDYNFEPSSDIWSDHYRGIFRSNQVLDNVPNIAMDETLKRRILAEAKFLRALYYFNLVSLYGNVPLVLKTSTAEDRPDYATADQVWAQVIADLAAAKPDLPVSYDADNLGRATRGAATALLAKSYMQLKRWSDAEAQLREVIQSGVYDLVPVYRDNFTMSNENNRESVFEVQFTNALKDDRGDIPNGARGNSRPKFLGPRGPSFADGQPTRWLFEEYQKEKTRDDQVDPRLEITMFYNKPGMMVYGTTYQERYGANSNELFWRKYTNSDTQTFEDFVSGINIRVIRYADVLLMYAEVLNELGRTTEAYTHINRVRARSNMRPLEQVAPNLTQAGMRTQLQHERALELAGEGVRFNDLKRWGLLSPDLKAHDPEFSNFKVGTSELLPIPFTEIVINPKLKQNPGW